MNTSVAVEVIFFDECVWGSVEFETKSPLDLVPCHRHAAHSYHAAYRRWIAAPVKVCIFTPVLSVDASQRAAVVADSRGRVNLRPLRFRHCVTTSVQVVHKLSTM